MNKLGIDRRFFLRGSAAALTVGSSAFAQNVPALPPPPMAFRRGRTTIGGKTVHWIAETGETVMRGATGLAEATIFSVAYLAQHARRAARPVTFVWNGGPGGASWQLRENISPRITVPVPGGRGYAFADNPQSLIDASDLVFIDAPGTGFSRMLDASTQSRYWGVEEDGRAFADFILDWLRLHRRLGSPIYLLGESYGGTRAGQVIRNLAEARVELAGMVLVSPTLGSPAEMLSARPEGAPLSLPSQAAVAWYHKRGAHVQETLAQVVAKAETFANGPYATALAGGFAALRVSEADDLSTRLSGFIGLPEEQVRAAGFIVSSTLFRNALLADRNLVIQGGDGRNSYPKPMPGQQVSVVTADAGFDRSAAIEGLIRDDLGYRAIGSYNRDPMPIGAAWNYKYTKPVDAQLIFRDRMATNTRLRVYLAGGYFDTIIPYLEPLAALRATLPPSRFAHHVYPTGHGVFEDPALRATTIGDLRAWYNA